MYILCNKKSATAEALGKKGQIIKDPWGAF